MGMDINEARSDNLSGTINNVFSLRRFGSDIGNDSIGNCQICPVGIMAGPVNDGAVFN